MIIFKDVEYELFFSNNLPLLIALNYADELFFEEFEKLCGERYRILSIIRKGHQQKYGLSKDIKKLERLFESKIEDKKWISNILSIYEEKSKELRSFLDSISSKDYSSLENTEMIDDIKEVRSKSAILDAMSNMLHLFSSLIGYQFFEFLHKYSNDKDKVNQNFIFYTQPIKESRFAKIKIKELKNRIELSERDRNFSDILRIGSYIKDDVSGLLDSRRHLMKNLFNESSKILQCQSEDIEYLQIKEIEEFLSGSNLQIELINKRKDTTVLYYPDKHLILIEGDDAKSFIKNGNMREVIENKEARILKGQIASLGKASGRVVIARNGEEALKNMKKGSILVASYTTPEYLPAMKKAAAIITETGGITSHAAIISRELEIPCVIGVEYATKVLKDRDLVEVDAEKGVVRKI